MHARRRWVVIPAPRLYNPAHEQNKRPPYLVRIPAAHAGAVLAALALVGIAALGLDLTNEGLVYDYLWNVTGETAPHKQVLGFGQYLMRCTRAQPDTQPYARIDHTDVSPFGVNTFLEQEVEPEKRERQVQMIAEAGFNWIRQQFPWEDIEIHGKGDFMDRRNTWTRVGRDQRVGQVRQHRRSGRSVRICRSSPG